MYQAVYKAVYRAVYQAAYHAVQKCIRKYIRQCTKHSTRCILVHGLFARQCTRHCTRRRTRKCVPLYQAMHCIRKYTRHCTKQCTRCTLVYGLSTMQCTRHCSRRCTRSVPLYQKCTSVPGSGNVSESTPGNALSSVPGVYKCIGCLPDSVPGGVPGSVLYLCTRQCKSVPGNTCVFPVYQTVEQAV
jgi:hypothetical protein